MQSLLSTNGTKTWAAPGSRTGTSERSDFPITHFDQNIRYPGCQCDIPAHNYSYSFEPNPEWPNYYATAVQIFEYMKKTSSKYKADQYMKFSHEIKSAIWNEAESKWHLKIRNGDHVFEDTCDVFINAGGVLK